MSATQLHLNRFHLFGLIVMSALLLALGLPGATPTHAAGNGQDYATDELGNPWDMSDAGDIAFEYTRDNDNLSSITFSNGELQATAKNGDPRITLLTPSHPLTNPIPTEGGYRPVSTSKYRYFTVRMSAPSTTVAQVFWQATLNSDQGGSAFQQVTGGGFQTITIDLLANGSGRTGPAWNASPTIQGLYFDPGMVAGPYKIDYIRLSTSIPTAPDNTPPITHITSPSYISGPDYASIERLNAWDMSDSSDVAATHDLDPSSISYSGGVLTASTVGGDSQVTLKTTTPINANKYKYLTYRMQLDGNQDTVAGSVARVLWWSTVPEQATISSAWVIPEGYQTVSFDLSKIQLEPVSFATWANSNPIVFRFDPHEFPTPRTFHLDYVMLTGDNTAAASYDIRYQTSDADGGTPTVQFFADTDTNRDNGTGTPIACGSSGAVITANTKVFLPMAIRAGATPPVVPTGSTCHWDTSNVAAGTYYVYAVTSDGTDTSGAYSQTPVIVSH